jgi:hypothetical protein
VARARIGWKAALTVSSSEGKTDAHQRPPPDRRVGLWLVILGGTLLVCFGVVVVASFVVLSDARERDLPATSTERAGINVGTASAVSPSTSANMPATAESGAAAEGGLTDSVLRSQVWSTIVSFLGNVRGCADVSSTAIEVTQEPDASGSWEEAWAIVACGEPKVLKVKFTVSPGGGLYYDIVE